MDLMEQIQNMSEADQAALLEMNFGEELEKQAAAELAQADLAEALYAYGAYIADREVSEQGELSKEASEEFDTAHAEITQAIEAGLLESGVLETDDTVALHKEAQAAAGIIFKGYSTQIEKMANEESKMSKMKEWAEKAKMKGKEAARNFGTHLSKHKNKYGLGAAALAAGGAAYGYKKHHEKKASEITASEMSEIVQQDQYLNAIITEGFNKLAEAGSEAMKKSMSEKMKSSFDKVKKHVGAAGSKVMEHMGKHKGKYGVGALALGAAGGAYAMKKKKD